MVAERKTFIDVDGVGCSLAKISMVAELIPKEIINRISCSLAKISMVAEPQNI